MVAAQHARAELLAHAEAHDHLLRRVRDLLEIICSAGGHLVEDDFLSGAAASVIASWFISVAFVVRYRSSRGSEIV